MLKQWKWEHYIKNNKVESGIKMFNFDVDSQNVAMADQEHLECEDQVKEKKAAITIDVILNSEGAVQPATIVVHTHHHVNVC